jgi:hypothetical protein
MFLEKEFSSFYEKFVYAEGTGTFKYFIETNDSEP